jgi:hypothetical protein
VEGGLRGGPLEEGEQALRPFHGVAPVVAEHVGPMHPWADVPVVNSTVHIYPINGAAHRVATDATAFAYRDANFATVIAGMWPATIRTGSRRTTRGNYERLVDITRTYDPTTCST